MKRWNVGEWTIFISVVTVCICILAAVFNSILNPGPYIKSDDVIYREACLSKGGIPNTRTISEKWSCEIKK